MLQQDYLMRMFLALAVAMRESMQRAQGEEDPEGAAELLENAFGNATEMDGSLLLQMAPETFVAMMQVSQTDPKIVGYLSRTLMLEAKYLDQANNHSLAELRRGQATALAQAYGYSVDEADITPEALNSFFEEQEVS